MASPPRQAIVMTLPSQISATTDGRRATLFILCLAVHAIGTRLRAPLQMLQLGAIRARLAADRAFGLTARKLGVQDYAVYAEKGLLPRTRRPGKAGLARLPWIGWGASVKHLVQARWQRAPLSSAPAAWTWRSRTACPRPA